MIAEGKLYAEIRDKLDAYIKEVLDEANADFPDEHAEKYKDRYDRDYYRLKYDLFIDDVQAWRKKWLDKPKPASIESVKP
jgi:hypothetical protein